MKVWPKGIRRSHEDQDSESRQLEVQIAAPEGLSRPQVDELYQAVIDVTRARLAEADLDREVVRGAPDDHHASAIEISVDARPAALVGASSGPGSSPVEVAAAFDRCLVRRRSILLDEVSAERLAAQYARAVDDPRISLYATVPSALLDLGISMRTDGFGSVRDGVQGAGSAVEVTELLFDALAGHAIGLVAPESVVRLVDDPRADLGLARDDLFGRAGLRLPDIAMSWQAHGAEPRFTVNDVSLPPNTERPVADWSDVVRELDLAAEQYGAWLIRISDVTERLDGLVHILEDMVRLATARNSVPMLTALIRALYVNGAAVRNLPRLLALTLDGEPVAERADGYRLSVDELGVDIGYPTDPEVLASLLRRRVAEEAWLTGVESPRQPSIVLPATVEKELIRPLSRQALAEAEWHMLRMVAGVGTVETVIVRRPQSIATVRKALMALSAKRPPRVIASHELPPDVPLPQGGDRSPAQISLAAPALSRRMR